MIVSLPSRHISQVGTLASCTKDNTFHKGWVQPNVSFKHAPKAHMVVVIQDMNYNIYINLLS